MSKESKWSLVIAGATLFIALVSLWVQLRHEQEHSNDLTTEVGLILLWSALAGSTTVAVWRNLRDAVRAKHKEALILTLRDDYRTQVEGLNKAHAAHLQSEKERLELLLTKRVEQAQLDIELRAKQQVRDTQLALKAQLMQREARYVLNRINNVCFEGKLVSPEFAQRIDYPLGSGAQPEPGDDWEWWHRQLSVAIIAFNDHRDHVRDLIPHFKSAVMQFFAPSDTKNNIQIVEMLEDHIKLLKMIADEPSEIRLLMGAYFLE